MTLQKGNSNQARYFNSDKDPTEVKLYAETLCSTIMEEHDVTSQSSHLIPEYVNLRLSGLRRRKGVQERDNNRDVKPKVFGLLALFASVAMSSTNLIITETESFTCKLLHHEEISKYSPENLPNFTKPLTSNIKSGNNNFTLK